MTSLIIRRAGILDAQTGQRTVADVGIRDGRIVEAGLLSGCREFDAAGLTLTFGLWDNHAHPGGLMYDPTATGYFEGAAERAIRAGSNFLQAVSMGITGVRSMGEASGIDLAWARSSRDGDFPSLPRILAASRPVGTTGGHMTAWPRRYVELDDRLVADGPDALAAGVRGLAERGVQWIKLMLTGGLFSEHETVDGAQLTDAELQAVMAAARERQLPVGAHCGSARWAERFAELGGRSLEHGYALDERAAAALAAHGVWLVPTLGVTHDHGFMMETGWPKHAVDRALSAAARHEESLRMSLAAGVRIATGADLNPIGPRLHAELRLLERAGMSRLQVLHAATVAGRELNGLGSSPYPAPGDCADILLLDDNPLDHLETLATPRLVVVHGRVVWNSAMADPAALVRTAVPGSE